MEKRREIKFRMWRDGKMQSVFQLNAYQDHRFDAPLETEEVLMQFTGLHDKNGKEIYEGDIVHVIYANDIEIMGDEADSVSYVYFDTESAGFMIKAEIGADSLEIVSGKTIEIIGNVFENQNLLTTPAQSGKQNDRDMKNGYYYLTDGICHSYRIPEGSTEDDRILQVCYSEMYYSINHTHIGVLGNRKHAACTAKEFYEKFQMVFEEFITVEQPQL